jgi:hypothetical protein
VRDYGTEVAPVLDILCVAGIIALAVIVGLIGKGIEKL